MVSYCQRACAVPTWQRLAQAECRPQRDIAFPLSRRRRGLSLLELILALGLSALVLYAISMAVDLHLRSLDVRRTHVEEAQIARAVLHMIASDLRGAVPQYRVDMSVVEQMAVTAMASAMGGVAQAAGGAIPGGTLSRGGSSAGGTGAASGGSMGGAGSGGGGAGDAGASAGGQNLARGSPPNTNAPGNSGSFRSNGSSLASPGGGRSGSSSGATVGSMSGGTQTGGASSGTGSSANTAAGGGSTGEASSSTTSTTGESASSDGSTANNTNLAGSANVPPVVGLYGNQYELRIDVSRLPRPDQYWIVADPANPALPSVPSDVKSITYFVQSPEMANGQVRDLLGGRSALAAPAVGLVRREIDRLVSSYAASYGSTDKILQSGDLLAPEVVGVQFQYFDGTTWLSYWDSQQMGGLPVAVEIILLIQPRVRSSSGLSFLGFGPTDPATLEPIAYRLLVHLPLSNTGAANQSEMQQGLENLGL